MWNTCTYTDGLRSDVCETARAVVDAMATPSRRAWWHGLSEADQLCHIVSSHVYMDAPTEKALRVTCVPLVLSGMHAALDSLDNSGFYARVHDLAA